MQSFPLPRTSRRRRLAVLAMLSLTALSCAQTASAAQDGTIFDDRVFEWRYYIDPSVNADLQNAGITSEATARWHWQTYGINEGRRGSPGFYSREYLAAYADLRNAYGATNWSGAITHYLAHGYTEARYSQSSCPVNYDLSTNGANVPRYCYARSLNATITSTDQSFSKYLFCFPMPSGGRIVNGLSGNISITTATAQANPSEALVTVGYFNGTCPANGTKYTGYPVPGTGEALGTFILKRFGAGTTIVPTTITIPAVAGTGSLYVLLDGGPSLGAGNPITSITMKSNVTVSTTTAQPPSRFFINGSDEYCFNFPPGNLYPTNGACPSVGNGNATIVTVRRAAGGGTALKLFGNTSAGLLTGPIGNAWTSRHDWYVTPCANTSIAAGSLSYVYSVPGRAPIPPGTPSYGYEQTTFGDAQHTTVNTLLPLPSTGVRSNTDCIVHMAYVNVGNPLNVESQVNYVPYYP